MKKPKQKTGSKQLREAIQFYLIDCKTIPGKIIDIAIMLLNILIVSIFIISTYDISSTFLQVTERIIILFFILEFAARFYGARNRIKYFFNFFTIVDILSILPTLLEPVISNEQMNVFLILRMFRVFRIFRFIRFFETAEFFFGRISNRMLKVMRLFLTIFMIFFVSSGLFYIFESGPDSGMIHNFGDAFYFSVVALTTVGFGDIVPLTGAGKAVTVICILTGIFAIPWQAGLIAREWINVSQKNPAVCSKCGLKYHDKDAVHCKACGTLIYQEYEGRSR